MVFTEHWLTEFPTKTALRHLHFCGEKSSKFDKAIVTLLEQKNGDFDHQFGGERVSDYPPLTTLRLKENGSLTHFFQIKRNMQLHLIAGVSYAQLG